MSVFRKPEAGIERRLLAGWRPLLAVNRPIAKPSAPRAYLCSRGILRIATWVDWSMVVSQFLADDQSTLGHCIHRRHPTRVSSGPRYVALVMVYIHQ